MKLIIFILSVYLCLSRTYTILKQCDEQWGNEQLGIGSNTICSSGSLVTSIAMMMNTYGIKLYSQPTMPNILNTWLNYNGGYTPPDQFVWNSINGLGFIYQGRVTGAQAKNNFDSGRHVFLKVRSGSHYVLMTSHSESGNIYYVNDPAYSVTYYTMQSVATADVYTYSKFDYFRNHVLKLE